MHLKYYHFAFIKIVQFSQTHEGGQTEFREKPASKVFSYHICLFIYVISHMLVYKGNKV